MVINLTFVVLAFLMFFNQEIGYLMLVSRILFVIGWCFVYGFFCISNTRNRSHEIWNGLLSVLLVVTSMNWSKGTVDGSTELVNPHGFVNKTADDIAFVEISIKAGCIWKSILYIYNVQTMTNLYCLFQEAILWNEKGDMFVQSSIWGL